MRAETGDLPPRDRFDCAVVGAGPAGAITARELARRGFKTILIDKAAFPRAKVCGCCLNPRALDVLSCVGLGELASALGAIPLTKMELNAWGKRVVLNQELGVAISRKAFDQALVEEAVKAGALFVDGTTASLVRSDEGADLELCLSGRNSSQIRTKGVVSATGLAGSLQETRSELNCRDSSVIHKHSRIGAGAIANVTPNGFEEHCIYMACGSKGYVGLVVLEDGRLDIAAALNPRDIRTQGGIGPLVHMILKDAGTPKVTGVENFEWKGTPFLTRRATKIAGNCVFRVGDAAGYVEPFTGEGMAWALAGGLRLASILSQATHFASPLVESAWRNAYRRDVRNRQLVCRAARSVLGTPWLSRAAIRILEAAPVLAVPVLRRMHRVTEPAAVAQRGQ